MLSGKLGITRIIGKIRRTLRNNIARECGRWFVPGMTTANTSRGETGWNILLYVLCRLASH